MADRVKKKRMTKITDKWLLDVGFTKEENNVWFEKDLPMTPLSPTKSTLSYNNNIMIWKQYNDQGMSIATAAEIRSAYLDELNEVSDTSFILQYNTVVFERKFEYIEDIQNLWKTLTNENL